MKPHEIFIWLDNVLFQRLNRIYQYCVHHVDLFLLLLLCVCGLVCIRQKPEEVKAVVDRAQYLYNAESSSRSYAKPFFTSELIPEPTYLLSAHSATLTVLDNGNLLALWFAGSHEGKPDVDIWQSIYSESEQVTGRRAENKLVWSMAVPVVSPDLLQLQLQRFVRKVGNPVVYKAKNGTLHLFVVSVALGGWSGSHLNHLISNDNGKTWISARRLILSPFLNISTLDRTAAITLSDGGFYLPVYHECFYTYPELLQFDKNGNFIRQIRVNDNRDLLQPAMVVMEDGVMQAFLRNSTRINKILYSQISNNSGLSWSRIAATNLDNQDSSIAVAKFGPDQLIMLHNAGDRSKLAIALSKDGLRWQDITYLENSKDLEFSYPAIAIHDGMVDILYTWKRQQIKHVRFNLSWLEMMSTKVGYDIR